MGFRSVGLSGLAAFAAIAAVTASAMAAGSVQVGTSGKTYASSAVECAVNPNSGLLAPVVEAGLVSPKGNTKATIWLNGGSVGTVSATAPSTLVWLASGPNTVEVALSKKVSDNYTFTVPAGMCDTSGNTFSADGTLEYGTSGKSYATVATGCALNAATGQAQPYVHLWDNGAYVLNVSLNGTPLTQLSSTRPHTAVFLQPGVNVISVAAGSLSVDYFVRDGGSGTCSLP